MRDTYSNGTDEQTTLADRDRYIDLPTGELDIPYSLHSYLLPC